MESRVVLLVGGIGCSLVCGRAHAQACDPVLNQIIQGKNGEALGSSIDLMGSSAVIGAYLGVANGVDSGVAYTYAFDGEQWVETGRLVPPDGGSGDWFGLYTAVDQDHMLIGSIAHDENISNAGAAYAYKLIDGQWVFEQKLLPMNAVEDGGFGIVDIDGAKAAVGAPGLLVGGPIGSVTIFEHDGEWWNATETIMPADGEAGDWFGLSVSLDGDRLIVGSPEDYDEIHGSFTGSVYVYEFDGEGWGLQARLIPSDLFFWSSFGRSVWLNNDRLVVGAPGALTGVGRVYCYRLEDGQWVEQQVIEPDLPKANGFFGEAISIDHDVMIVGADSLAHDEAYVYRLIADRWESAGVLDNVDAGEVDVFGAVLDVYDGSAMVLSLSRSNYNGEVLTYDLGCSPCRADFDGDWVLDSDDVELFVELFNAGDAAADLHGDGVMNFFDVSAFLVDYAAGCP